MFRDIVDPELRSLLVMLANTVQEVHDEWYDNLSTVGKLQMIKHWNRLSPEQSALLKQQIKARIHKTN